MEISATSPPTDAKQARLDEQAAKAARARGFVTEDQLHECQDMQILAKRHLGRHVPLSELLFLRGLLSVEQLKVVAGEGASERTPHGGTPRGLLGQIAVESGFCTREDLLHCLDVQAAEVKAGRPPRPLGAILVSEGVLKVAQLDELLHLQKRQRE